MKTFTELMTIPGYLDRFEYLKLSGFVGDRTFGGYRYLNQMLYHDSEWKRTRRGVILRDNGYDLGHKEHPICSRVIIVHHITPITVEDIMERRSIVFDPENLISCSHQTHNAIHYGDDAKLDHGLVVRTPNDTCPWR